MRMRDIVLAHVATLVVAGALASAQVQLPPDPDPTCVVSQEEIKQWFHDGNVKKDGPVHPASSFQL